MFLIPATPSLRSQTMSSKVSKANLLCVSVQSRLCCFFIQATEVWSVEGFFRSAGEWSGLVESLGHSGRKRQDSSSLEKSSCLHFSLKASYS